jgi:cell division protease FtsH
MLRSEQIPFDVEGKSGGGIGGYLIYVLPFVLFLVFWLFVIRQMSGTRAQMTRFGKSKVKLRDPDQPRVTFTDVAGVDEAVEEL